MKKFITILLLSTLTVSAFAGKPADEKWTYRIGAAYYPSVTTVLVPFLAIGVGVAADEDAGETAKIDFPPYVSFEGIYSFNTRWSLGMSVGYCGLISHIYNSDMTEKSKSSITIVPVTVVGRCNYLYRPKVKLYGSLEGGIMFSPDTDIIPSVQLNPLGIEFGGKVFGLVEVGVGLNYTGVRAGLGWRFK